MGMAPMEIQFGSEGIYSGTMGGAQVSGTYSLKGKILEMQPPTISGPGGSSTPSGGVMRVKLVKQGPNAFMLDAGERQFHMIRIGPPN